MIFAVVGAALMQGQTGSMQPFAIIDPVLQMPAWTVNVPAGWKAEGTMVPSSSCSSGTAPVFRAFSPDGQAGAYMLPPTNWAWGPGVRSSNDCLALHEVISAKDFLTYLARIREVGIVREEPVPELARMRRDNDAFNERARGTMQITGDMARYLVRYYLNGQPIEEWLTGTLTCTDTMVLGVGNQHGCAAYVTRWFAPLGKLQTMIPTFQAMKMTLNQQWMDQWTATMVQHTQRLYQQQTDALLEQGRLAQGQRTREHLDFISSMQQGRDNRNQQFKEGQYQKQKSKEDYVDYILDCQRLSNGQVRVSVGNCVTRETP